MLAYPQLASRRILVRDRPLSATKISDGYVLDWGAKLTLASEQVRLLILRHIRRAVRDLRVTLRALCLGARLPRGTIYFQA